MRVLLSIKPEYAEKIFNGTKKFEFRKLIFKKADVKTVVVYASSPLKMVIGEFEIETIMHLTVEDLWKRTSEFSGITKDYFDEYFANKEYGYAIKIKAVTKYPKYLSLHENYKVKPPQSFLYLAR